jgi:hypothetical protein
MKVRRPARLVAATTVVMTLLVAAAVVRDGRLAVAEPAPAYELVPLPEGLDTLSSLLDASNGIEACADDCTGVVFLWTPRMPLSRIAIPNVERATRELGARLTLVGFEELEAYAEAVTSPRLRFADELLAAGSLSHAPALVVVRGGEVVGPAILGYKSTDAYRSLVAQRSMSTATASVPPAPSALGSTRVVDEDSEAVRFTDYEAVGVPGAYFRWVPGRRAVAYESRRKIYLLDLDDGVSRVAPGNIDFVPTPDGRYFVTPLSRQNGLAFYDADRVMEAAREGRSGTVRPLLMDPVMTDQYPSIGILSQEGRSVRYRVLTSWFEGLVYRDYEIARREDGQLLSARALGEPVVPCEGMALSTPIMSQDGQEVAARDEASGTTKIYRILEEGRCEEVLALGMPTRKVAWHATGRKLAFSTPRVRTASGGGVEPGIFVYDRDERRLTRVADSEGASQLAFPDFVGDDAIVFMMPGRTFRDQTFFRVVRPIP